MCGTFSQSKDGRVIMDSWAQRDSAELRRKPLKYISREDRVCSKRPEDIYPSQKALVLLNTLKDEVRLQEVKWGLVATWADDPLKSKNQHFNARSETAMNLATFRESYKKWRCLVPMTGYYEYKRTDGQLKPTKYFISTPDKIMWVAALFSFRRQDKEALSFSILTEEPSATLRAVHHRKPIILKNLKEGVKWLNGSDISEISKKNETYFDIKVYESSEDQMRFAI